MLFYINVSQFAAMNYILGIDNPQKVRACLAYLKGLLIQRNTNVLEEPTSSDERDSGVGMNCDHLTTSNDTEEEPCSPSVTDSG
jgi:hypothetical protein